MDQRMIPARPDLAAEFLRGVVKAERYAPARRMAVIEEVINLRAVPAQDAMTTTQALFGEEVDVYEDQEGWVWGQLANDKYVGYMPANALRERRGDPSHRVNVPRSFAYPDADMKLPPLCALPLGAALRVTELRGDFLRLADDAGFVFARHASVMDAVASDFVAVAEQFMHAPYLWGGRTSMGLDCSALLQTALRAAGRDAPRDSDMIEAWAGEALEVDDGLSGLRRGNLVFWRGHCGMMRDAQTLLHANGHHMQVASEPLREARDRILAKSFGPITSVRRPAFA